MNRRKRRLREHARAAMIRGWDKRRAAEIDRRFHESLPIPLDQVDVLIDRAHRLLAKYPGPLPTSGKMPISTVPSEATAAVNSGNKASE